MQSDPASKARLTKVFVEDLHTNRSVSVLEDILLALSPRPSAINVSVEAQVVEIHHSSDLSYDAIQDAIRAAGFHVVSPPLEVNYLHEELSSQDQRVVNTPSIVTGIFNPNAGPSQHTEYISTPSSATQTTRLMFGDRATSVISRDPGSDGDPCRLRLSVGGMTCSSCSSAITTALLEIPGVTDISVSLLNNAATVVIENKMLSDAVVNAINDCGFEAQIFQIESLQAPNQGQPQGVTHRTVSLRVDGMLSQRCIEKVMASLDALAPKISVIKPLINCADPILQISYEPAPPVFTIRTILSTIASSQPLLRVSIHEAPTVEDVARQIRMTEQTRLLRRLIFSFIIAVPTFILSIVFGSLVDRHNSVRRYLMEPMWAGNASRMDWAMFILATPVMFYSANLFHQRSIKEITNLWRRGSRTPILKRFVRFGSMNLLVSSGVTVAYVSSIALLVLASLQVPSPEKIGDGTTYFDSVVLLTMFLLAGRYLEAYSKTRTADSVRALGSLRPNEALLLVLRTNEKLSLVTSNTDMEKGRPNSDTYHSGMLSGVEKIDARHLEIGDIIRVLRGATPPCDGTIVVGQDTAFDESSLTGESRLVMKQVGDQVFVGTINKSKVVDIRVESIGSETMLGKIIEVVREGQTRKAPIERVADLITGYFVPVVTLLAVSTWVIWLALGLSGALPRDYLDIPIGGWPLWSLEFAIAVFVVACPCGIGLAAPTALLVGTGLAAKFGILARGGGEAFQEMAKVDLIVFDKTGTLTKGGDLVVSDYEVFSTGTKWAEETILSITADLESSSSHPLATAIRLFCGSRTTLHAQGSGYEETPGRGLQGHFRTLECSAIIGNEAWMREHAAAVDDHVAKRLATWKSDAKSVVLLALRDEEEVNGSFVITAIFAIMDPVRPEAKGVVSALHEQGISIWMISGDNVVTAMTVAAAVGIPRENVIAEVLPQQKAVNIERLRCVGIARQARWKLPFMKHRHKQRHVIGMVGDGINDAPALSIADVGIAIGSGSDVAISSASFVLLSSNLQGLLTLRDLSCKVLNRIKFNFFWAICYNLAALPIAAGVLYPFGHARLNPVWASLAMALSSVSVVCSSLLLKLYREPKPSSSNR